MKSVFTYKMSNYSLQTQLSWYSLASQVIMGSSCELHLQQGKSASWIPKKKSEHVYKQLVQPSIEYCSVIWDHYHHTIIYKLEMIQHRAAPFVLNKPWYRYNQQLDSVTDMLTYLKWPILQNRRTTARLTLLFKTVNKLLEIPDDCLPSLTPVSHTQTLHPLKLAQLQPRIDVYKYSFLPKTIIQWNLLNIPEIHTMNLETFKNTVINIFCDCNAH